MLIVGGGSVLAPESVWKSTQQALDVLLIFLLLLSFGAHIFGIEEAIHPRVILLTFLRGQRSIVHGDGSAQDALGSVDH